MATPEREEPLAKLAQIELVPEVYGLLQGLQQGLLQAKDFDNHAGNVRLKLALVRQLLEQIEGISESVDARETRIEALEKNNARKREVLADLRAKVEAQWGRK